MSNIPANVLRENALKRMPKNPGMPQAGGGYTSGPTPSADPFNQSKNTILTEYFAAGTTGGNPVAGVLVLPPNPKRNYLLIQNNGTVTSVFIRFVPMTAQFIGLGNGQAGLQLGINGGFYEPFVPTVGFVSISWNTANGVVYALEGVAP